MYPLLPDSPPVEELQEFVFDAYLWQTVENKQKFISQIMTSKSPVRSCEDVHIFHTFQNRSCNSGIGQLIFHLISPENIRQVIDNYSF